MAHRLQEVLRFFGVRRRRGDQGPALRQMHEEIVSSVGTEDPADVGGLQRVGGEPVEGDPVVFQHGDRGQEASPSERRPEPVPEPMS